MRKDKELFFFFNITDVPKFKSHLANDLHPLLTSTTQALSTTNSAPTMINIAFSQLGLTTLNITDNLGDSLFANGQKKDFSALGDPSLSAWQPEFQSGMHGVMLIASNDVNSVTDEATNLLSLFDGSISEVYRLLGQARPGSEAGHERKSFHFASPWRRPSWN
jgi:deferrochelatase/peroxidase EfeB